MNEENSQGLGPENPGKPMGPEKNKDWDPATAL